MKRVAKLFAVVLTVMLAGSCAKSLKDVKVTSYELTSFSPRGLTSFDATVDLGVDNPSVQFSLSKMNAVVKIEGTPCLNLTAEDVMVAPRSEQVYPLVLHGSMADGFNPFSLLVLLREPGLELLTIDVSCRGTLKSGLGKDFEYKDLPITDLMSSL